MVNKLSYQELVRLSIDYHTTKDFDKWEMIHDTIYHISLTYNHEVWYKEGRRLAEIVENSPLYKALNEE